VPKKFLEILYNDLQTISRAIRNGDEELRFVAPLMPVGGIIFLFSAVYFLHGPNRWVEAAGLYNGLLFLSYQSMKNDYREMEAYLRLYIPISLLALLAIILVTYD